MLVRVLSIGSRSPALACSPRRPGSTLRVTTFLLSVISGATPGQAGLRPGPRPPFAVCLTAAAWARSFFAHFPRLLDDPSCLPASGVRRPWPGPRCLLLERGPGPDQEHHGG